MRTLRLVVGVISITIGVEILPVLGTSHYLVRSHELTVELSSQGQIVGVLVGKEAIRWDIHGQTELAGCRVEGLVQTEKRRDGGVRFKKKLLCDANQTRREVQLVEVFTPTNSSVRWEVELDGMGPPWSTRIETRLSIPEVNWISSDSEAVFSSLVPPWLMRISSCESSSPSTKSVKSGFIGPPMPLGLCCYWRQECLIGRKSWSRFEGRP